MAVVDGVGRVIGVEGLRVIDASILPGLPRANTHLTVLAVAERLADDLRRESGAG
jgi:choline dehydrogenase-like flavoprotein